MKIPPTTSQLKEMYLSGMTILEIHVKLDRSNCFVRKLFKKYAISTRRSGPRIPKNKGEVSPAIEALLEAVGGVDGLRRAYQDEGVYALAHRLGKAPGNIQYLLGKYSISENRGHKDAKAWNKGISYSTEMKGWTWSEASREAFSKKKEAFYAAPGAPKIGGDFNKGKTWDEIFGIEKAQLMRQALAERNKKGTNANTSIEIALQKGLSLKGVTFETQRTIYLPGRTRRLTIPDIFIEPNICVYTDGDYWHRLPGNPEKDALSTSKLLAEGYIVLIFWEKEINKNLDACISKILEVI